jgi:type IV pilus assembly protein PilO
MPKNFNLAGLKWKDPRVAVRAVLGLLLAANLVAAVIAFKPFGGSVEDLRRDRDTLEQQLAQLEKQVGKNRKLVEKIETARREGGQFLAKYFASRRVMTSTVQSELVKIGQDAGIVYQPTTMSLEPIEGSDTLSMMTINAGCQGTYPALSKFVNLVDKSPRFLIIDSMAAAPQQTGQILNVTVKVFTFVKDDGADAPADEEDAAPDAPNAAPAAPAAPAAKVALGAGI